MGIEKARKIIKENYDPKAGIFWTGGKDSTLMLWLIREQFPDLPNPVIFLDSGDEFPEIYQFIGELLIKWNLKLHKFFYNAPTAGDARLNKIRAIKEAIDTLKLNKIFVAIRKDECVARSVEKTASLRPTHIRVHPLLYVTEKELWDFIKKNNVPFCSLYNKGYRSLGEKSFTKPGGETERGGREAEKERIMALLRDMGYF